VTGNLGFGESVLWELKGKRVKECIRDAANSLKYAAIQVTSISQSAYRSRIRRQQNAAVTLVDYNVLVALEIK